MTAPHTSGRPVLLAVDVGNTNIVLGLFRGDRLGAVERIPTHPTSDEAGYIAALRAFLAQNDTSPSAVGGAILSSVVLELTAVLPHALEAVAGRAPLVVGAGLETGVKVKGCRPEDLGADLVVGAAAALAKYPCPLVLFDMGTATTMTVLDPQGWFLGGAIMAGPKLSLDALAHGASQLPAVVPAAPQRVVSLDTAEAMRVGAICGQAAMLDGLVAQVEEELGYSMKTVVGTGGLFRLVAPFCRRNIVRDDDLLLDGLRVIYQKNGAF